MARYDIRVWNSPHGGHGRLIAGRLAASETFVEGEPVALNAGGFVTESAADPTAPDIAGIAVTPGNTTAGSGSVDFRTGNVITTGAEVLLATASPENTFITSNFSNAGTAFGDAAPALADIGDEVGLSLISGSWGVDQNQTNETCRIIDVLDANYESLINSGGTGVHVVFVFIQHQLNVNTAPVA